MRPGLLLFCVFVFGLTTTVNGQFNDYKYIIVPKKFNGYKTENKYLTSTYTKHLFAKKGFNAVYDDELPEELGNNRCLGLMVDLLDDSSMFTTKVTMLLKDCQGVEIYRSIEGRSKIKDFRGAYREALQNAFAPIQAVDYAYVPKVEEPKKTEQPIVVSFKDDVKNIEKEEATPAVVVQEATPENQSFKSMEPKKSNFVKAETPAPPAKDLLYAQPTENGYQLVDSSPKVVLKLIKTSVENIFLVDDDTKNGMVFKKGDKWFLEYTENNGKNQQELHIKF